MKNDTLRILVRPEVDGPWLQEFMAKRGCPFLRFIPSDGANPDEWIWHYDLAHTVHYVEDGFFSLYYLVVVGPHRERVMRELRADVPTWSREQVLELWDARGDEAARVELAGALGISAPIDVDRRFVSRLEQALTDSSPAVRYAAVFACLFTHWNDFVPAIEKLVEHETDARVEEAARAALQSFAALG